MYQQFKKEWNTRRIDFDRIYAYQCVDLIFQYLYENGVTGVYGNAIDYKNITDTRLLNKFDRVAGTDCQPGDIVVLNGLAGNRYGHIGICDSQTASTVRLLEQNGAGSGTGIGKDAIGIYRDIPKSRIASILRPKGATPIPTPPPARSTVTLPKSAGTWRLYRVGSTLRPNTSDQITFLLPGQYGDLTYKIESWVGDYAVVITTGMAGRGVIWVKGTEAIIK